MASVKASKLCGSFKPLASRGQIIFVLADAINNPNNLFYGVMVVLRTGVRIRASGCVRCLSRRVGTSRLAFPPIGCWFTNGSKSTSSRVTGPRLCPSVCRLQRRWGSKCATSQKLRHPWLHDATPIDTYKDEAQRRTHPGETSLSNANFTPFQVLTSFQH